MEGVTFILSAYVLAALTKYATRPWVKEPLEPSLCLTCVNAVVTRGTRGQKWVACNLNGTFRPVKFAVCECTAFCVPGGPPKLVTIEGFAPEQREVYAKVAIGNPG